MENQIYTSVGSPILISLNPYAKLPLYSDKISDSYRGKKNTNPHLYQMAENAYSALKEGNQSIIISGESGAGKTEAAKIILSYLAGTSSDSKNNLSKQVLDTNPILEAFGNAKTLRNDNSSRFGKFIEIHFDSVSFKLLSARIQNYLLEKSRIVSQQIGERNYHFFYQLCAGATDEEREKFHILPAEEFLYLTKGQCLEIEGVDDSLNYSETRECMQVLGFSQEEQESIIRIVVAILHLGNVEFSGEDATVIDNPESLDLCCELLGIKFEVLEKVLTTRVIIDPTNNKEIVMKQNPSQAYYTKDATAKAIYSKLFSWLVERINKSIYIQQKKASKIIGLLDIYGFEVFDSNSFEQFCINYANEKLQQQFNNHMFKMEQQVYSKEKIKWDHIKYEDNQDCIDLIEKTPIGIISLLDEQSKLQKGSDKQFLSNLYSKLSGNPKLCNPGPLVNEFFGIGHYAGDVYYDIAGFLDKNKDTLNPQLIRAIESSTFTLLRDTFAFTEKNPKKKQVPGSLSALSLGSQFKNQLQDLIKALSGSTPSYIRCIKPNSEKAAKLFDSQDVQRQLRCAGMLECIRIRKAGYSVRRGLKEFLDKYWIIAPSVRTENNITNKCKKLIVELSKLESLKALMNSEKKLLQLGLSMVFMKDELRQSLDIEYSKAAYKFAVIIQKSFRRFFYYKKFKVVKTSVKKLQRKVRAWLFQKNVERQSIRIKAGLRSLITHKILYKKSAALIKVKQFLSRAASILYLSYFRPINYEKPKPVYDDTILDESTENSFQFLKNTSEDYLPYKRDENKRVNYSKELTSGQSPVIDTLQAELRSLSHLLNREKEKSKSAQEETLYYKSLYQSSLLQIQSLQTESQNILLSSEATEKDPKNKSDAQAFQREINLKNNEISLLQMKLKSLNESIEEIEETNKELKQKEAL